MDKEEIELQELVKKIQEDKQLPAFEVYITLLSLTFAVIFFSFPTMLYSGSDVYVRMLEIMPQYVWALALIGSGICGAYGLYFSNLVSRYIGLTIAAILYFAISICFMSDFPALGAITFLYNSIASLVSLGLVKHTSLFKVKKRSVRK